MTLSIDCQNISLYLKKHSMMVILVMKLRKFLAKDLDDCYSTLKELKDNILHVSVPKKTFSSRKISFSEKSLAFLYSSMIKFIRTDKVKGIPLSENFIENLNGIMTNAIQIHHSHVTGKIIGYAHNFCNAKVRENYHKVTVTAHNLFRFNFFFLLEGLRAVVWRTRDLFIDLFKSNPVPLYNKIFPTKFRDTS